MNQPPSRRTADAAALGRAIAGVVAGDPAAEQELHGHLLSPVTAAVRSFLGADDSEADDIIQETLVTAFRYIRDGGGFEGDLISFSVTVARNRCRNALTRRRRRPQVQIEDAQDGVADPSADAVERLLSAEALAVLRAGVARLGRACRALLVAFYLEERSIEEIRVRCGLKTVQGVYYRRQVCIRELASMLAGQL
ncbi:MAG: sigma-70 family RNA polymerase sigma factor [bacterium]|nr:sigma-70 family RNA polymerase sigma factor [bacterium]